MAEAGKVLLLVYTSNGDLADKIEDRKLAGDQVTQISTSDFAPGVYYYLLRISYDSGIMENHSPNKFAIRR